MSSKPIPPLGLTAFRLLTAAYVRAVADLTTTYQKECEALGDEILTVMGEQPTDPALTVCYGDGVVTGFRDLDVEALVQKTIAQLQAERPPEATPVVTPEMLSASESAAPA